jgi:hypothetical protein
MMEAAVNLSKKNLNNHLAVDEPTIGMNRHQYIKMEEIIEVSNEVPFIGGAEENNQYMLEDS